MARLQSRLLMATLNHLRWWLCCEDPAVLAQFCHSLMVGGLRWHALILKLLARSVASNRLQFRNVWAKPSLLVCGSVLAAAVCQPWTSFQYDRLSCFISRRYEIQALLSLASFLRSQAELNSVRRSSGTSVRLRCFRCLRLPATRRT